MKPKLLIMLPLLLAGCEWASGVGSHIPTVGERCEYWQCFTEYGKKRSDEIKKQREAATAKPAEPDETKQ
jgi:hypothetical protein